MNQEYNTRVGRNHSFAMGLIVAILSFGLFLFATVGVLQLTVTFENIFAYMITSLVFGLFALFFYRFDNKVGFILYVIGLAAGFIQMIITFTKNLDGWNELAGLASLFVFAAMGLGAGLLVLLLVFLFGRKRK